MKKTLLSSAVLLAFTATASAADPVTLTENWTETLSSALTNTIVEAGNYSVNLTYAANDDAGILKDSTINSTNDVTLTSNKTVLYTTTNSIKGNNVTVKNTGSNGGSAISSYGSHTIEAMNNILLEARGDTLQGSGDMHGNVSLTAGNTITIRSLGDNGEAIQGFHGQFSLKAKKVVLESVGGQAISQRAADGSVYIEADDIEISAYQGGRVDDKLEAVWVNAGTMTFNVKNSMKVTDNGADSTAAIGIDGDDGKLVIKAKEATIDGNIDAAQGEVQLDGNMIFEGDKAEIADLTGTAATFTMTNASQDISIGNANEALTLAATGDVNDEAGIDALKNIALTGNTEGVRLVAYEGMNANETTAVLDAEGNVTKVVETTNSIMSNTLDLASATPLAMNRILMNDVRKRMGDLRSAEGTHGVWARYDGGKLSGERGLDNDFTTIQIGADTVPVAGAPRFGVAFAYTTSEADMLRGSADMDAFSLAFYGTKLFESGMFVDVIGRMATADTDIVVDGNKKGSMDNIALSLSGELGWRFNLTDTVYLEPQAELTYTHVNSDTLKLTGGYSYEFDSVDSLLARAGFAAGIKCPNNRGDLYVRASAVHEFLGDAAVRSGRSVHETDGKDTWVEFGIGGQFNINKSAYVWADIERTEGAKLEEDWRANVGVRFNF